MMEDEQGRYVRIEDAGCPPDEQIAEAVTVARLPLLQAIKDLEAQVKVLREDSERKSGALRRLEKFSAYTARRHA